MKNFGCLHPMQSKTVNEKSIETLKAKYGVEHISQSEEIKSRKFLKKTLQDYKNLFKYKEHVLPNFTLYPKPSK